MILELRKGKREIVPVLKLRLTESSCRRLLMLCLTNQSKSLQQTLRKLMINEHLHKNG